MILYLSKTTYKNIIVGLVISNLERIGYEYIVDTSNTCIAEHNFDLRLKLASFSKNNPHQRVTLLHTNYFAAFIFYNNTMQVDLRMLRCSCRYKSKRIDTYKYANPFNLREILERKENI